MSSISSWLCLSTITVTVRMEHLLSCFSSVSIIWTSSGKKKLIQKLIFKANCSLIHPPYSLPLPLRSISLLFSPHHYTCFSCTPSVGRSQGRSCGQAFWGSCQTNRFPLSLWCEQREKPSLLGHTKSKVFTGPVEDPYDLCLVGLNVLSFKLWYLQYAF